MNLAPIILFVYNRPWHTLQTLEALAKNELAEESVLYIYADGAKGNATAEDLDQIAETRTIIRKKEWCKKVTIIESETNKGLADSVIRGTTDIVNKYGKVITLEDDVVTSKYFLKFMNEALDKYSENNEIFMVGGYNFPVKEIKSINSSFFIPLTSTQAWGTWKRAWTIFDINASGYEELKTNDILRKSFNLGGIYDYSGMLFKQMEDQNISSWAIKWWWSVFKKNGLVLYPDKSLIKNIGWDATGRHSGKNNPYFDADWSEDYFINKFPETIRSDEQKFNLIKTYITKQIQQPILIRKSKQVNFVKNIFLKIKNKFVII